MYDALSTRSYISVRDAFSASGPLQAPLMPNVFGLFFSQIMVMVQGLQDRMEGFLTKERIATKLVSSLGGEKERWTSNIAEYEEEISRLVGDALTLAGTYSN